MKQLFFLHTEPLSPMKFCSSSCSHDCYPCAEMLWTSLLLIAFHQSKHPLITTFNNLQNTPCCHTELGTLSLREGEIADLRNESSLSFLQHTGGDVDSDSLSWGKPWLTEAPTRSIRLGCHAVRHMHFSASHSPWSLNIHTSKKTLHF